MNVILLSSDEVFIRYLDPSRFKVVESREQFQVGSLSVSYAFSDNLKSDLDDFQPGNKLFITGFPGLCDCLYVINEQVQDDLWKENSVSFSVEEVLVELNYAPLVSMADVSSKTVTLDTALLERFFGEWYHIGTVETGLLTNTIQIDGTMSRMSLLRYIEETTGNVFNARYEQIANTNKIKRTLDFLRPYNVGDSKDTVIDLGYNTDDVQYLIDESDSYRAISPLLDWNEDSEISRNDMITLINCFKDLEIRKSTNENVVQVPFLFSEPVTSGVFPKKIEGQLNNNYWRRIPGDSSYSWYPGLINYISTVTTGTDSMALKSYTETHAGTLLTCTVDGTCSYWNGTGVSQVTTCKVGDQWLCNGITWKLFRLDNSGVNKPKYITVDTALYYAPFNKKKGELFVYDESDTKIQYKNIHSRADYTEMLNGSDDETDTSETVETGETPDVEPITNTQHLTPKIGTITTSETNEIALYNACCTTLKEKKYPSLEIDVNLKDIQGNEQYNIFDTVQIKMPNFDYLIGATVVSTEKNPNLPGEDKITLSTQEINGRYNLLTPHFELQNSIHKHKQKFNFTGKLLRTVPTDTTTTMGLRDDPVPGKWISVAVIRPESNRTVNEKHITQTTTTTDKTSYWSKYGVSPDKNEVCGIGYTSTGADTHPYGTDYKGVFKNYCPNCKKSGGMRWNRGSRCTSMGKTAAKEGEFTCKYCDSDYSIEGNEKGNTHTKMSKISFTESNATDSAKLIKGKLVYDNKTSKTTNTPGKTTVKTEKLGKSVKLYTVKTKSDGSFTVPLTLIGLENEDYTVKCTFGGDSAYESCTDSCSVTVPPVKNWATVYDKSTSGGSKSTVTDSNYSPIPRNSSNTKCTNLKRQSGVVSKTVQNKARSIVGNKTGLEAAKLLAKWVSNNCKWKYNKGFYQKPTKTLSSKKGNCCCLTDLFLQMCEACNLNVSQGGDLYIKYVHVRVSKGGHVYALIRHKDNAKGVYVDVSHKNCWGNVCSGYGPSNGAKTTSYPCLPFERTY